MAFSSDPLVLVAAILAGVAGLLTMYVWRQQRRQFVLVAPPTSTDVSDVPFKEIATAPHTVRVTESTTAHEEDLTSVDSSEDQGEVSIKAMLMQLEAERHYDSERLKQVRRYFREVSEQYKLPPFPAVVTTALRMVRQDNTDLRQIGRVLSNDAALAGRILSLSRSPIFALRQLPRTLQESIAVLGLRTLERVLVAAGAQSVYAGRSKASQTLWNHSLATALACQFLGKRIGLHEVDQAFLAGLLHDVGQMVILHGDRARFEGMWTDARLQKKTAVAWEREWYHLDHIWIGASVLYRWGLAKEPILAVLRHHDSSPDVDPSSVDALVQMANFLADRIGLGFLSAPTPPAPHLFEVYGCDTEERLQEVEKTLQDMFKKEKALFS